MGLVGDCEGWNPYGRPRRGRDLPEGWKDVDWIILIHVKEEFRAVLYMVMNLRVFIKCEEFLYYILIHDREEFRAVLYMAMNLGVFIKCEEFLGYILIHDREEFRAFCE
jgi:hypothetical protein